MRGRALLLANRNYRDGRLAELPSADADVSKLGEVLANPKIGNFDVATLVDASCQDWREQIEAFYADASHDETLLLFVSSHAVKDQDGQLYFCAQNTNLQRLLATGVSAEFTQQSAFRSRSRRQIMIFDSCFAGAFARGYTFKSGGAIGSGEYFRQGGGRIVITASDEMQYAFADAGMTGQSLPSVFTKHLVEGLKTGMADPEGLGHVTVDSLFRYVEQHVIAENPRQSPQKWTFALSGDIVVARNPNPRPAALPEHIIGMLSTPDTRVRVLAVADLGNLARSDRESLRLAALQALHLLSTDDSRRISEAALRELAASDPDSGGAAEAPPPPIATTPPAIEKVSASAKDSQGVAPAFGYRLGNWLGRPGTVSLPVGLLWIFYGLAPFVFRDQDHIWSEEQNYGSLALIVCGALLVMSRWMPLAKPIRALTFCLTALVFTHRSGFGSWPFTLLGNLGDTALLWLSLLSAAVAAFITERVRA